MSKYSGYFWESALKWANSNRHDYITIMGLKFIPNSKKGESQYEFAYFEPSNRCDAYVGRGIVGIKLYDHHDTTKDVSLEELKKLFPIRHTRMLEKIYKRYSSEQEYDEKEELLWALIKYIFIRSGFKIIY